MSGGVVNFRCVTHAGLDFVGNVRDDLDGVAEVFAAAFLCDDGGVDLAGGHVSGLVEVFVQEALVVSDVEVGFSTVVGDKDFTVLEGVHRTGVDVQVGVELLHGHREATCAKKLTEGRGRQALTERRCNAAGHENLAGYLVVRGRVQSVIFFIHHGIQAYHFLVCYPSRGFCRERILSGGFPSPICPYHHCKRSWGFIIPAAPCRSRCRSIHRVSHILWAPCAAIGHRHGLYRQLSEARSRTSAPLMVFSAKDAAFRRFCQHFLHAFPCRFAVSFSVPGALLDRRPAALGRALAPILIDRVRRAFAPAPPRVPLRKVP